MPRIPAEPHILVVFFFSVIECLRNRLDSNVDTTRSQTCVNNFLCFSIKTSCAHTSLFLSSLETVARIIWLDGWVPNSLVQRRRLYYMLLDGHK